MKIEAKNAYQFLRHCEALQKMAGIPVAVVPVDGMEIYAKLRRLELKAHRMTTHECNSGVDLDYSKVEKAVRKLFGGKLDNFFVNRDPRGYALKIRGEGPANPSKPQLPEDLDQDWGGYGILAPEF